LRDPEEELLEILDKAGVDFTSSLPCEKFKCLLQMIGRAFFHVPLTREEEGVGICAGASLAGKRPAIFVQSSGVGNMINALLSLTGFYQLPLALFISQRGIFKEKIEAQFPMGRRLPGILRGAGISHSLITSAKDFPLIERKLDGLYLKNKIHAFLLSPEIWEKSEIRSQEPEVEILEPGCETISVPRRGVKFSHKPALTRFEILQTVAPSLDSKIVVCNLGFPSKELFHIRHQPSNFYMLGSMGMATPVGLGISLSTKKDVVVIDGDGSLLMNPGTLATAAHFGPRNLTILAIDNSAYGSTGNQPTFTGSCVDLAKVASGFGIKDAVTLSTRKEVAEVMKKPCRGLRFIHVRAVPGNMDLPPISLGHLEIKQQVKEYIIGK